jgi:hypothetical protein
MVRTVLFIALAAAATPSLAAGEKTNWGIRAVPGAGPIVVPPKTPYVDPALRPSEEPVTIQTRSDINMSAISRIGARWGRVTSTYRSPSHNRAVGGVPNSFHLSGRAIDIARRPGVSHWQIAAELRQAGYNLIESLDEGDHSHFAFGCLGEVRIRAAALPRYAKPAYQMVTTNTPTRWKVVYAPGSGGGN